LRPNPFIGEAANSIGAESLPLRGGVPGHPVDVNVRQLQDVKILDLSGKILGGSESDALRMEMDRILHGEGKKILINLNQVPWMNSAGLGILLSGYSRLRENGGAMAFYGVQERVREILETTKLVTVLEIFADEESGLKKLRSAGPAARMESSSG